MTAENFASPASGEEGEAAGLPTGESGRLISLDFVRGVAVLGILAANIVAFGHPMLAYTWPGALPGGGTMADGWIWLAQFVLVDGKFRGLFTLLFGAGMYLFVQRCRDRGETAGLQARRLLWLGLFGLAHFYLLFIGDILVLYAVSGLVALAMLGWSAKGQLWGGLAWYLMGALFFTGALGMQAAIEAQPAAQAQTGALLEQMDTAWQGMADDAREETVIVRQGSYGDILSYRFFQQSDELAQMPLIALFETIPLMLIGMGLLRLGFFAPERRERTRVWCWIGLTGGALASLGLGWWAFASSFPPYLTQFVFSGAATFPRLPMTLGLCGLLVLAAPAAAKGWLGERLIAAGRMAFSNYIGTSLVMLLIFHGWAGGKFGELDRVGLLLPMILGWLLMLAWSRPWLARFRYGPLEWLWRCLTYGRFFALRR